MLTFGITDHGCFGSRGGNFVADTGKTYRYEFSTGSPHCNLPKATRYRLMIVGRPPEGEPYNERHLMVVPVGRLIGDAEER